MPSGGRHGLDLLPPNLVKAAAILNEAERGSSKGLHDRDDEQIDARDDHRDCHQCHFVFFGGTLPFPVRPDHIPACLGYYVSGHRQDRAESPNDPITMPKIDLRPDTEDQLGVTGQPQLEMHRPAEVMPVVASRVIPHEHRQRGIT
jgi:hypothetical protein